MVLVPKGRNVIKTLTVNALQIPYETTHYLLIY